MDKYIKQLLSEDSRVIIPRFGCIQALREETVLLSFNPYLNFDDGKLTAAVQKGEGISEEEARTEIGRAVDNYNNTLQDGGTVIISGVGSFHRDADGIVEFTQEKDFDASLSSQPSQEEEQQPTQPEPEPEPQPEPQQPTPAPVPAPTPVPKPTSRQKNQSVTNNNSSKKGIIVGLVILLLLILLWLLLFVVYKDNVVYRTAQKFFFPEKAPIEAPVPAPVAPADTTVTVEPAPVVETPKKEDKKAAPTTAQPLKKRYNIIVGSYRDEPTAIKRVNDLHAKGFENAFVGIRKDHFVAVLADFNSISEAERVQEQAVEGQYHIESWITNSGEYGK